MSSEDISHDTLTRHNAHRYTFSLSIIHPRPIPRDEWINMERKSACFSLVNAIPFYSGRITSRLS